MAGGCRREGGQGRIFLVRSFSSPPRRSASLRSTLSPSVLLHCSGVPRLSCKEGDSIILLEQGPDPNAWIGYSSDCVRVLSHHSLARRSWRVADPVGTGRVRYRLLPIHFRDGGAAAQRQIGNEGSIPVESALFDADRTDLASGSGHHHGTSRPPRAFPLLLSPSLESCSGSLCGDGHASRRALGVCLSVCAATLSRQNDSPPGQPHRLRSAQDGYARSLPQPLLPAGPD